MEKNIFEQFIFENQKGGLALVKFAKEQKGGGSHCAFDNRFKDLVVPAGLVSCSQPKPRLFDSKKLNTSYIGEQLFDNIFENIRVNKKKNTLKNLKQYRNTTKKKM